MPKPVERSDRLTRQLGQAAVVLLVLVILGTLLTSWVQSRLEPADGGPHVEWNPDGSIKEMTIDLAGPSRSDFGTFVGELCLGATLLLAVAALACFLAWLVRKAA